MGPLEGFTVEPLAAKHDRGRFSCGQEDIDRYIRQTARKQDENSTTRLHVYANEAGEIAGFYTLSALTLELAGLPELMRRGRSNKIPVPATLLGRLAIDKKYQGTGVGKFLLSHAIWIARDASRLVASAMLVIDAKPSAIEWYQKQPIEFEPMPEDPLRLLLPFDF